MGHLNYMPVGEAAEAMVRLLRLAPGGLSTYHVIHHHDVAVALSGVDLFNAVSLINASLVDGAYLENPNFVEKRLRWAKGFLPYLRHSLLSHTTGRREHCSVSPAARPLSTPPISRGVGQYKRQFLSSRGHR